MIIITSTCYAIVKRIDKNQKLKFKPKPSINLIYKQRIKKQKLTGDFSTLNGICVFYKLLCTLCTEFNL